MVTLTARPIAWGGGNGSDNVRIDSTSEALMEMCSRKCSEMSVQLEQRI